MKIGRRIICILMAFACFTGLYTTQTFAAQEKQTIRVGYMDYKGFIDEQSDGSFSGYGAEYLTKISEYANFRYEYVYGEWTQLLQMLEAGEIDFLCTAQYTDQRAQQFDFSDYPIGYSQGLLYTTMGNDSLYYENYESFNGRTIGIIKNSAMKDIFLRYSQQHEFTCNLQEYETETEMVDALKRGDIEAICCEHIANHTDLALLAKFGADAFYIISYKNSPYMDELNYALQEIKTDVDFEANLFHKYYDDSAAETTLQFTVAEKEFIEQGQTIQIGLNTNRAPFSEYDETTGTFTGICVDILDIIQEKSGLTFKYMPQELGATTPDLIESGKYDIICGVERDNFLTSETLMSSDAFLESAIVPVGRSGTNFDINSTLTAAIPSSFQALQKRISANYPNLNMVLYKSNQECLDAVKSGEADLFIQNTHIISLLLQEPKYDGLDILPVDVMTEHTAMAMSREDNEVLLSIINKCIRSVEDAAISSSLIQHTFASPYKYTTMDFLYKFRIQIVLISVLTLCCFALLIGFVIIQRQNEAKLQKKNQMLAEAVALADRANTAKSQFLSQMSHEIRTPMNAIVGLTEIAKQHKNNPEKIDDFLTKIGLSSKVLLNIINDVLDMSAIESNKLNIANAEFDIKQVLNGISTIYYAQCKDKGIEFKMVTDVENENLIGDSLRVNQILLNLVSNAYKFTDAGGTIEILVQETAQKEDMAFIRFTVSDTGCGMAPDMLQRLFKPFEQEDSDTTKKHGGSGLGLSIAKSLVDLMHGAIKVESEKGVGSTFTVDLPFEIDRKAVAMSNSGLKGIRVLTVDDDPAAREYTKIVLKRIGVNYHSASSGAEALELIEEAESQGTPYDVCLIDWKMPDMDGLEVTRRIREKEDRKTLIIIVSAYDLNEVEDESRKAGANYFVAKPLFQSTVFNVLMTLTNGELKDETVEPKEYDFTGHRVLLAEDNDMNAEIAEELLKMVQLQVERVEDGKQALERFLQCQPGYYDLILMDVQMPNMNGYEATKAIRVLEREDAQEIPIFAMTANAFAEDVSESLSCGMNGHISKPIDTGVLYETLAKTMNI